MKLVRFGNDQWGTLEEGAIHETKGRDGAKTGVQYRLDSVKLLPPATPSKIVCVGRNYLDHIKEMGNLSPDGLPKEPGLFLKTPNTIRSTGNPAIEDDWGEALEYPDFTDSLHFEGELALVIGKTMRNVSESEALSYVFGYTVALDWSARDKQKSDLQWTRAKSSDGFLPLGPWLETELIPGNLSLKTRLNEKLEQDASTAQMIFSVEKILSYISSFMTLEAGDVVITGTPDGVGAVGRGDKLSVEIEGIGLLKTSVK